MSECSVGQRQRQRQRQRGAGQEAGLEQGLSRQQAAGAQKAGYSYIILLYIPGWKKGKERKAKKGKGD